MTWRLVAASVRGSSHAAAEMPCQDSNWASPSEGILASPVLCAFAADGAGSAIRGGDGAELAMAAVANFMRDRTRREGFQPDESVAIECLQHVRNRLALAAEETSLTPRDYACTLLGVVSTATQTLLVQVGDGGIVVDVGEGLALPIIPMSGEYANMTYFITDEDALSRVQLKSFSAPVQKLAVFTDGLQRLAINMAAQAPHEPFFAKFFSILGQASLKDEEKLQDLLAAFLKSRPVEERTDDDRTLVLATLQPH